MKKMTSICAGLLLLLSSSVFAEEHLTEALEHANAAAVHGEAGDTAILIGHAKVALEQVLEASIVAKARQKTIWMMLLRSYKNQLNSLIWVI